MQESHLTKFSSQWQSCDGLMPSTSCRPESRCRTDEDPQLRRFGRARSPTFEVVRTVRSRSLYRTRTASGGPSAQGRPERHVRDAPTDSEVRDYGAGQ